MAPSEKRRELSEVEKGMIIAFRYLKMSYASIGQIIGRPKSTIAMAARRIAARNGSCKNAARSGRPKKLSPAAQRHLRRSSIKSPEARRMPLAELAANSPTPVSARTVKRTLGTMDFKRNLETVRIILDAQKAEARLKWCQAHAKWTVSDWRKVVWSDECSVSRYSDAGRVYVTRTSHERWSSDCVKQNGNDTRVAVMFWGCFYNGTKGPLVSFDANVNSELYLDLIQGVVPEIMDLMDEDGIFMHDNARPHTAKIVKEWFQATGYKVIEDWPPYSPDLNPIEHVWRRLKILFGQRYKEIRFSTQGPAAIKAMLKEAVPKLWDAIDSRFLESLVESMPRRIAACIEAKGYYTKY